MINSFTFVGKITISSKNTTSFIWVTENIILTIVMKKKIDSGKTYSIFYPIDLFFKLSVEIGMKFFIRNTIIIIII